jgi:hypothetical protein
LRKTTGFNRKHVQIHNKKLDDHKLNSEATIINRTFQDKAQKLCTPGENIYVGTTKRMC